MALHKAEHRKIRYWVYWPICGLCYLMLLPYAIMRGRFVFNKSGKKHWRWAAFQALEDHIDDPIDWLKHKIWGVGTPP